MISNKRSVVRFLAIPLLLNVAICNSSFAQETTSNCIDTDGDGWGWDGTASCRIQPIACIDTDGDGWGWNGQSSCLIDTQSGCVDTDGDGWGWNGYQTCLITDPAINEQSNANACLINGVEVSTQIDQFQCDTLMDIYASTYGDSWNNNNQWATSTDPCNWYGVSCADNSVYELDLFDNNLTGPLPESIGSLHGLETLRLSSNQLTGSIPSSIGKLSNLEVLYLANNLLSGSIPPEIGELSNLEVMYIHGNQLSGAIPPEIGNLGNLAVLHLADNALEGIIPDAIGNMDSLYQVFLENNNLSGTIPTNIGYLPTLEILYLSSNVLTGEIPSTFSNLDLIVFNASKNQLGGNLDSISTAIRNNETFLILNSNQCFTTTDADLVTWLNSFDPDWDDGCY